MKHIALIFGIAIALLAGCMATVVVDKRPNLALPILSEDNHTNDWLIVDQGYRVKYSKVGFSTHIDSMAAEINTNKTVSFHLGGLDSIAPTNSFTIKIEDLLKLASLIKEANISETNGIQVLEIPLEPQG